MKQAMQRGLWWGGLLSLAVAVGGVGTNDQAALCSEEQTRAAENRRRSAGVGYQLYLAPDPQRHARQAPSTRIPRGH